LAQIGPIERSAIRSLLGVERTYRGHRETDAFDPSATSVAKFAMMHKTALAQGGGRVWSSRSVGELLMMPRTWEVAASRSRESRSSREVAVCCSNARLSSREVAVCCATASLSLRVSSAIFSLLLICGVVALALRRGGFTVLRRFVLGRLVRAVVTQSSGLGARGF
jgi:hypothetical protein